MKKRMIPLLALALILPVLSVCTGCGHNSTQNPSTQWTDPVTVPLTTAPTSEPTVSPETSLPTEPTVPSTGATETTLPPTEATEATLPPTEATKPPTVATKPHETTAPPDEYIGKLYTRAQLEALDGTRQGYGQGFSVNEKNRPILAEQIQKQYGKYDAHFIGPDNNKVYLTFSLGYEYENLTAVILDTLKAKNIKAVFFVNYSYAKKNPALIRRMIEEGHTVGNHATNHYDMGTIPIDKMVSEIMTLHNYVRDTYQYEMKLFHPPSGYFNERLLAVAQSLGYKTVNWSYSYLDWDTENQPQPAEALKKLNSVVHSGAIYSLHTTSATNAAILGDFIDATLTKGLEFELFQ